MWHTSDVMTYSGVEPRGVYHSRASGGSWMHGGAVVESFSCRVCAALVLSVSVSRALLIRPPVVPALLTTMHLLGDIRRRRTFRAGLVMFLLSCVWCAEERRQLEVPVNGEGCIGSDVGEQASLRFPSARNSTGYRTKEMPPRGTSDDDGSGSSRECFFAGGTFGDHGQKLRYAKDRRGSDSHEICLTQGFLPEVNHAAMQRWAAHARRRKSDDAVCTSWQREISRHVKEETGWFALPDQKVECHSKHPRDHRFDESTVGGGERSCRDQQMLMEASILLMKRRQYVKVRNLCLQDSHIHSRREIICLGNSPVSRKETCGCISVRVPGIARPMMMRSRVLCTQVFTDEGTTSRASVLCIDSFQRGSGEG